MAPRALAIVAVAALVASFAADALAFVPPKHPAIAAPKPPRAAWAGRFRTDYGLLVLSTTESGQVTGTYSYGTPAVHGRLHGDAEGDRLRFEWIEPNGGGRGVFDLAEDGASFEGRWGSGASEDDGGVWNGSRD